MLLYRVALYLLSFSRLPLDIDSDKTTTSKQQPVYDSKRGKSNTTPQYTAGQHIRKSIATYTCENILCTRRVIHDGHCEISTKCKYMDNKSPYVSVQALRSFILSDEILITCILILSQVQVQYMKRSPRDGNCIIIIVTHRCYLTKHLNLLLCVLSNIVFFGFVSLYKSRFSPFPPPIYLSQNNACVRFILLHKFKESILTKNEIIILTIANSSNTLSNKMF